MGGWLFEVRHEPGYFGLRSFCAMGRIIDSFARAVKSTLTMLVIAMAFASQ
jgi:hypothetical protein